MGEQPYVKSAGFCFRFSVLGCRLFGNFLHLRCFYSSKVAKAERGAVHRLEMPIARSARWLLGAIDGKRSISEATGHGIESEG